jgi:hypothetical protein
MTRTTSRKAAEKSPPPTPGVRVRMYNPGLGDCFLLTFETSGGERPRHVLIDCGALATPAAQERLPRVVRHIRETAGPGGIDVVILTHPALGSVSGFLGTGGESLSELPVGEVWAAWTEDPHDPAARTLERRRASSLEGLRAATDHLRATAHPSAELLDPLLGIFGQPEGGGGPTQARRAFETMLRCGAAVRFQAPGDRPCPLPGVPGVRVYVLGPPRSGELERPGRGREEGLALGEDTAFFLAALDAQGTEMDGPQKDLRDRCFPFEKAFRVPLEKAKADPFFKRHYFVGEPGKEGEADWRTVESEWTGSSTRLALQLDRDVNDASLALAFELPDGRVLLFPGNAQEAQWRSWQRLSWPREEERDHPVTVSDLLRRTVLYKASHHGSQAGTPWEDGLARMTHPDLMVMVPVDEAEAREPGEGHPGSWDFPFGPLLDRFREVARGRVLLPDRCLPDRPDRISREEWKTFEGRSKCEPGLYVEVTIPFEKTP